MYSVDVCGRICAELVVVRCRCCLLNRMVCRGSDSSSDDDNGEDLFKRIQQRRESRKNQVDKRKRKKPFASDVCD